MGKLTQSQLNFALMRFPENRSLIRRLFLSDAEFRDLCNDFGLAKETLDRLEKQTDANKRPEIAEYSVLIAELGAEIEKYLRKAGTRDVSGGAANLPGPTI